MGRGGWRRGAGRPRGRTTASHAPRAACSSREPVHVTLRIVPRLASLRRGDVMQLVRTAIARAQRDDFRIVEFNVLHNHLHLLVEATDKDALARGMQGLNVRLARGINARFGRRGPFFLERYHGRVLRTPREVRAVLRYVLLNLRHHAAQRGERLARRWLDPCSSALWFDGWRDPIDPVAPWMRALLASPRPTRPPRSWLLSTGWRRWGLIPVDDARRG